MDHVYVVPAAGGRVRQPERHNQVMPPEGGFVPRNSFWERLIVTGDVTVTDPPKPAEAPSPAVEATAEAEATAAPSKKSRNVSAEG